MVEAREHESNCFLTLTYEDEHLPDDRGLHVEHWQKFAKRLRKRCGSFRFFHCGEYGPRTLRPHFHACLFGLDFASSRREFARPGGHPLYRSSVMDELWPFGFHSIGALTFDSAAYVARYVTKKVTGEQAVAHYERMDSETGEVWSVRPEYATMSRRPGIGQKFFERYGDEVYRFDSMVFKGREYSPPRYFDKLMEARDPERYARVQKARRDRVIEARSRESRDPEDVNRIREKVTLSRLATRGGSLD